MIMQALYWLRETLSVHDCGGGIIYAYNHIFTVLVCFHSVAGVFLAAPHIDLRLI